MVKKRQRLEKLIKANISEELYNKEFLDQLENVVVGKPLDFERLSDNNLSAEVIRYLLPTKGLS